MNSTRSWDIYETETLAVRRSLSSGQVREELRRGTISDQDLIRPSGSERPWRRIAELPAEELADVAEPPKPAFPAGDQDLLDPDAEIDMDPDSGENAPAEAPKPVRPQAVPKQEKAALPSIELQALQWLMEDDPPPPPPPKARTETSAKRAAGASRQAGRVRTSESAAPILEPSIELKLDPAESDEPLLTNDDLEDGEGDFTLARSRVEHVEEMDLAAMVDIAFQLVLFFMVTASVTMIKSMELPKPTETTKPAAASAPGVGTRDRNELETEFIVVKISADGEILVEDEPVAADRLIERLRSVRNESGKTGMLLRAENRTKHRLAVAAYDAANEIGLRIAIERETGTP